MKKWIYLAELLLIVAMVVFGLMRKEETVLSMRDIPLQEAFVSEQFAVTPGVFEVRVTTTVPKESTLNFVVQSTEETNFRGLMSNAVNMSGGEECLIYEFYATEELESLCFTSTPINVAKNADVQGDITIVQTGKGWIALAMVCLIVLVPVHGILYFRRLVQEKRVGKEQQVVAWVIAGAVLLSCIPCVADCLLQTGREATYQSGGLFVLPAVFLRLCGLSVTTVYQVTAFWASAATAVIAYICFYKCVRERYGALAGAVIYVLNPYRLYSLYGLGDMAEYLAMTFLPLLICGVYQLLAEEDAKRRPNCAYYLAVGFTGLLHTSPALCLLAVMMMLVLCLCFWKRTIRKGVRCQIVAGMGLFVGCNLWFLVPFLQLLSQKEALQTQGAVETQGRLGLVSAIVLLLCLIDIVKSKRTGKKRVLVNTLFGMAVTGSVLSTRYLPWEALLMMPVAGNVFAFVQTPIRMMAFVGVFCAFLACVYITGEDTVQNKKYTLVFLGILAAGVSVFHLNNMVYFMEPVYVYSLPNPTYLPMAPAEVRLSEASGFWGALCLSLLFVAGWVGVLLLGRRKKHDKQDSGK